MRKIQLDEKYEAVVNDQMNDRLEYIVRCGEPQARDEQVPFYWPKNWMLSMYYRLLEYHDALVTLAPVLRDPTLAPDLQMNAARVMESLTFLSTDGIQQPGVQSPEVEVEHAPITDLSDEELLEELRSRLEANSTFTTPEKQDLEEAFKQLRASGKLEKDVLLQALKTKAPWKGFTPEKEWESNDGTIQIWQRGPIIRIRQAERHVRDRTPRVDFHWIDLRNIDHIEDKNDAESLRLIGRWGADHTLYWLYSEEVDHIVNLWLEHRTNEAG